MHAEETKINMFDHMGSLFDYCFLSIPHILKPFKPKRTISRSNYEEQVAYYFDNGYVDNPISLFKFSDDLPKYQKISQTPYKNGHRQIFTYNSLFETVNPLIKDYYNSFANNKTGYLVRWTHGDENRKTVICLHGYMLGEPKQAEKMFRVKKLFKSGLDVVLFVSPFHWKRAPDSKALRGIFIQPDDVVMTCEAVLHTMFDLNSSLNILKDLKTGDIGLIGASMGGYNASLFVCLKGTVSFSAMMVPALSYSLPFGPESMKYPFQMDEEFLKKLNTIWEIHSPLKFKPLISKNKILFIASKGDKLCNFNNVKRICEKWDWPRHYFLTGGHWLIFNDRMRGKLWYEFLSEKDFI